MSSTTSTENTMLPDVAAYFAENTKAEQKYIELRDAYRALRDKHTEAIDAAREAADKAYRVWQNSQKNWSKLTEATDPLVKWIGDNCSEYPDYAEQILRALPADFATLEDIARRHDWCNEFDRLAQRAIAAGVIDGPNRTEAYEQYQRWMARNYTSSGDSRTRLANLVKAEREAAVEQYKAELAAAQAKASEDPSETVPASE